VTVQSADPIGRRRADRAAGYGYSAARAAIANRLCDLAVPTVAFWQCGFVSLTASHCCVQLLFTHSETGAAFRVRGFYADVPLNHSDKRCRS